MAKSELKIQARKMRAHGVSVNKIAEELKLSKSTISLWVRDIILSIEQLEALRKNSIIGSERARLQWANFQKNRRIQIQKEKENEGISMVGHLSNREFFVSGIALYWAEGSKKSGELSFCNSDPKIIQFMINWFEVFFNLHVDDFRLVVGINEIHREREFSVTKYWSRLTKIPQSQFQKTSFKKVQNKKIYENFSAHYGTLTVRVLKSRHFYYKMLGLISGLSYCQRSSAVERSPHKA